MTDKNVNATYAMLGQFHEMLAEQGIDELLHELTDGPPPPDLEAVVERFFAVRTVGELTTILKALNHLFADRLKARAGLAADLAVILRAAQHLIERIPGAATLDEVLVHASDSERSYWSSKHVEGAEDDKANEMLATALDQEILGMSAMSGFRADGRPWTAAEVYYALTTQKRAYDREADE